MKMHIIACNSANQPMHTFRDKDGNWQSNFGNVNGVFTNGTSLPSIQAIDAECVQQSNNLMVCVLGANNRLYVSKRKSSGTWEDTEDISQMLVNVPGITTGAVFTRICCTHFKEHLQIFALTQGGQAVHIGHMNASGGQSWFSRFFNVTTGLDTSSPLDITCFYRYSGGYKLVVAVATANGNVVRFRYKGRTSDDSDQLYLNSTSTTPVRIANSSPITGLRRLSGNFSDGKEHYLVCLENGQVLHNREGNSSFNNINAVNGNPAFSYSDVGCFDISGRLHVGVVRNDGKPYHTYRESGSNSSWQGFMGDINAVSTGAGVVRAIALG